MQLRVILCMPEKLAQGLLEHVTVDLTQEVALEMVLHQQQDTESEIYKNLEELSETCGPDDAVLVICDSLGSRSCTLALSMTPTHVSVITGCNIDMLEALPNIYQKTIALECNSIERLSYAGDLLYRASIEGICLSHAYLREPGEESSIYSSLSESLIADSRFS